VTVIEVRPRSLAGARSGIASGDAGSRPATLRASQQASTPHKGTARARSQGHVQGTPAKYRDWLGLGGLRLERWDRGSDNDRWIDHGCDARCDQGPHVVAVSGGRRPMPSRDALQSANSTSAWWIE
jgi:hypothetical protein